MWAKPDDCRSVANNAGSVSINSVQPEFIISPNVDQNHEMIAGRSADDFGPLQIEVGCRHALLASDIVHAQLGVLDQARLDGVCASHDPEQARIGCPYSKLCPTSAKPRIGRCSGS